MEGPQYTVGLGGVRRRHFNNISSAKTHPGLFGTAAFPEYSYSDMVTQATYVGTVALLEYYFDVVARARGYHFRRDQLAPNPMDARLRLAGHLC